MADMDDKARAWWEEAKDKSEDIADDADDKFHETKGRMKEKLDSEQND
jgi:hypothetical protein